MRLSRQLSCVSKALDSPSDGRHGGERNAKLHMKESSIGCRCRWLPTRSLEPALIHSYQAIGSATSLCASPSLSLALPCHLPLLSSPTSITQSPAGAWCCDW
jgi:hypothetical protein